MKIKINIDIKLLEMIIEMITIVSIIVVRFLFSVANVQQVCGTLVSIPQYFVRIPQNLVKPYDLAAFRYSDGVIL